MARANAVLVVEVGNGPGHFQDSRVGPRTQAQFVDRHFQEALVLNQFLVGLFGIDPLHPHTDGGRKVRPLEVLAKTLRTVEPGIAPNGKHRFLDALLSHLPTGAVLTPARIALAASQGHAELEVARRPTVAVFATGDELVEPGLPLAHGQVYNSNREQLMGLLRVQGLEPVHVIGALNPRTVKSLALKPGEVRALGWKWPRRWLALAE